MFTIIVNLFRDRSSATGSPDVRTRLSFEQLGDRIVPTVLVTENQPPPPPSDLPGLPGDPKGFDKIEDVIGEVRKDKTPRRIVPPGEEPPLPTAGSILEKFEKAGGAVVVGTSPTGGAIEFPTKPGDKPRIVLDPTKLEDMSNSVGVLIFELVRYEYRQQQIDLDAKAKKGEITPEQYATESERLAYAYVKIQHDIVLSAVGGGRINVGKDRYEFILKEYPTFEKYLQAQKDSKHFDRLKERAERWERERNGQPVTPPTGTDFSNANMAGWTYNPYYVGDPFFVGGEVGSEIDPDFYVDGTVNTNFDQDIAWDDIYNEGGTIAV